MMAACPMPLCTPLREVRLYGPLGARFGRVHRLAISTPHEAVRALSATVDGFAAFLLERADLAYKVFAGPAARTLPQLNDPVGTREVVRIVPLVAGAKANGLGMILAGAALFYGAPLVGGLMGSTAVGSSIALYGMKIGAALMLGGVISLLSPQRRESAAAARPENQPSYAFDGPVNTSQQGLPVPLVYGRVITGGAEISAGMTVDDISPAPAPAPAPAQQLPPEQPISWEIRGGGD